MSEEVEPSSLDAPTPPVDKMLTDEAVAAILDVSKSYLAKARMRGEGPPFIKLGKSVRYFPVGAWLAAQRGLSPKKR